MTLVQLRYAVMVADKGSISEAAKALYISQPSLTSAIKELENEMCITIFDRTNRGVSVSAKGDEFLAYARQILGQVDLMEDKYKGTRERRSRFSVSCQHYSFAVSAFVDVINEYGGDKYDFTLRETQTYEIIEDVSKLKSEVGVLYLSGNNEKIISKILRKNDLIFTELSVAAPHVFISNRHPLVDKDVITIDDLEDYPYLTFEQGDYNSFYFSEEIMNSYDCKKNIKVRDRATLFNLVVGLNGYTVSSGVINDELNWQNIVARPLKLDDDMHIGVVQKKGVTASKYALLYIERLKKYIDIG